MPADLTLPTFESLLHDIAAAERGDGWLSLCRHAGRYLATTRELAMALAGFLRSLEAPSALEVCAGSGELTRQLRSAGVQVVATDAAPAGGSAVIRASAEEALRRHQPAVVLGSFVPVDAGVDERVMGFPSVRHYVVLGARLGGLFGSAALWRDSRWAAEQLADVSRWMLTRHDVWLGTPGRRILQHGEAWHFRRTPGNGRHEALLR